MFDIGFSEMVVIALIALIVLGPTRLPEVARSAGRWVGKVRRFVENVKRDIDQEIKDVDLAAFREMQAELDETRSLLQKSAADTFNSVTSQDSVTSQTELDTTVEPALLSAPLDPPPLAPKTKKSPKSTAAARTKKKPAVTKPAGPKTHRTSHGSVKKPRTR